MSDTTSDQPATVTDHEPATTVGTAAVTVEQAAAILGVSVTTVRRRIRDGSIRAEEARRPQGPVWLVYLPSGATPPTVSDQPSATVPATAPTNAENTVAYTRTLLEPLVAALERAHARVAELERENGALDERVRALEAPKEQPADVVSLSTPPDGTRAGRLVLAVRALAALALVLLAAAAPGRAHARAVRRDVRRGRRPALGRGAHAGDHRSPAPGAGHPPAVPEEGALLTPVRAGRADGSP